MPTATDDDDDDDDEGRSMNAARRSAIRDRLRAPLAALLAAAIVTTPAFAGAQEQDETAQESAAEQEAREQLDDLFGDDDLDYDDADLFGDGAPGDEEEDGERVVDEFAEQEREPEPPKELSTAEKIRYWGFYLPVDVLVTRPIAGVDTLVGLMFFSAVAMPQSGSALIGAATGAVQDGEWYVDQTDVEQAWQQLVADPYEYFVFRELGTLTFD